jgi:hypothetical protein
MRRRRRRRRRAGGWRQQWEGRLKAKALPASLAAVQTALEAALAAEGQEGRQKGGQ